jgi:hypothetical protein
MKAARRHILKISVMAARRRSGGEKRLAGGSVAAWQPRNIESSRRSETSAAEGVA